MTEQNSPDEPLFGLRVDHDAGQKFLNASKWASFIAIIYFIGIGLALLVSVFAGAALNKAMSAVLPGIADLGSVLVATVICVSLFVLFIGLMLYRFAKLVRTGIERQDQRSFNEGLRFLRNYFMINGVVAILGFVLNAYNIIAASLGRF